MNVVRFHKRLHVPVPELPELTPFVGKEVEIIAIEELSSDSIADTKSSPLKDIENLDAQTDGGPIANFDQLKGGWPAAERDDGFEQAVEELRRRPWTREVE